MPGMGTYVDVAPLMVKVGQVIRTDNFGFIRPQTEELVEACRLSSCDLPAEKDKAKTLSK